MIKISVQYLKIAMLYLKISVLKIAVHSLKIAGLKIIARVCVYVRMWVRGCVCGCAPHLANISKIVQDATRAGRNTSTRATTEHRNTSDHHKSSTRAGATTTGTQRTRIAKEIKKTIANKNFFYFFRGTFVFEIKIKAI